MVYKLADIITPTDKGFKVRKVRVRALSDEKEFFDDAFPNGLFVEPRRLHKQRTKLRPMLKYCKEIGKTPSELTDEEIRKFISYP